jgi:glutamate formiminotransferase
MGAVDVVPFVPLGRTSMASCITLARDTARLVAERFRVPVYLYEEAARRPERTRLDAVRHGQFEGLLTRMADPAWVPDEGPHEPHASAGATAIGARHPLIAFNVNLATDRIEIARAIAHAIRERDGGLPAVKALGLRLERRGLVQVSVNLIRYRETSLQAVYDAIAARAEAAGVGVVGSEVVGLVPADALLPTAARGLRFEHPGQVRLLDVAILDQI